MYHFRPVLSASIIQAVHSNWQYWVCVGYESKVVMVSICFRYRNVNPSTGKIWISHGITGIREFFGWWFEQSKLLLGSSPAFLCRREDPAEPREICRLQFLDRVFMQRLTAVSLLIQKSITFAHQSAKHVAEEISMQDLEKGDGLTNVSWCWPACDREGGSQTAPENKWGNGPLTASGERAGPFEDLGPPPKYCTMLGWPISLRSNTLAIAWTSHSSCVC